MSSLDDLRAMLRSWQCEACKTGDRTKCGANERNFTAYMERPDGTRTYFCNPGCLLLLLDDTNMKKAIEDQFSVSGHYEKSASFWNDLPNLARQIV